MNDQLDVKIKALIDEWVQDPPPGPDRPAGLPETLRTPSRLTVPQRAWLVAASSAFGALLLIGGVAWVLGGSDRHAPAAEPLVSTVVTSTATTTQQVVTTEESPTPTSVVMGVLPSTPSADGDGSISTIPYEDVPAFVGSVRYGLPGESSDFGSVVEVTFSGSMRYQVKVIGGVVADSGSELAEWYFAPGTVFTGDGKYIWRQDPFTEDPRVVFVGDSDPWRHLFFDSAEPGLNWPAICEQTFESIGVDAIAGRYTSHVRCGVHDLWIDEATGVVLKMSGPFTFAGSGMEALSGGGFEFTSFELGDVAVPPGGVPEDEWLHTVLTWGEGEVVVFDGPARVELDGPKPMQIDIERGTLRGATSIAVVEIARGWHLNEFMDYVAASELTFAEVADVRLPDWVTFAGMVHLPDREMSTEIFIPWLTDGVVHVLVSNSVESVVSGAEVGNSVEVHIGQRGDEGSYLDVACGFAPEGFNGPVVLVSRTSDGARFSYSYTGPSVVRSGEVAILYRIARLPAFPSEGSSYATIVGLAPGYNWDDVVALARAEGRSLREFGGLAYGSRSRFAPEWARFALSLETGCHGTFVTGVVTDLPPGRYFIAASEIPGIFEVSTDQLVAVFEATG